MMRWPRGGATFDPTRTYRYNLWRERDAGSGMVAYGMLNPSTAAEDVDDNTIRRCLGFAEALNKQRVEAWNLYAYCATHPSDLARASAPIGPDNDRWILDVCGRADLVIVAWGAHAMVRNRAPWVLAMLAQRGVGVTCLRRTKGGFPEHPSRLPGNLRPEAYR